jgi:hypothetical protein
VSDFVNLNCPACGGQLQVQKDMQKYFCMHCGTELLLKQDDAGIFSTIQARDLQASAKLKEMQFSVTAMDLLKSQIAELEGQFTIIRNNFLTNIVSYRGERCFREYEKEYHISPGLSQFYTYYRGDMFFKPDRYIMGYTSIDDFLALARFLQRPAYQKKKYLVPILITFEPLPAIAEELKAKKAQLNQMLEQAINN